jgi:hypothetical protein
VARENDSQELSFGHENQWDMEIPKNEASAKTSGYTPKNRTPAHTPTSWAKVERTGRGTEHKLNDSLTHGTASYLAAAYFPSEVLGAALATDGKIGTRVRGIPSPSEQQKRAQHSCSGTVQRHKNTLSAAQAKREENPIRAGPREEHRRPVAAKENASGTR